MPDTPGAPSTLLAAMATAFAAVLAMRIADCGTVTLTAVACGAVFTAVAALASALTGAPLSAISSIAALVSLCLLEIAPSISIRLAGLAPTLPPSDEKDDTETLPTVDSIAAKAIRADQWLTSLLGAFSWSAAIGGSVAALATHNAITLTAITGALLLLRVRLHRDRDRALVIAASGVFTTTITFAVAVVGKLTHGPWIAALTAILATVAMFLGFVAPTVSFSPIARRSIQALECLALICLAPLTCGICGVFNAVGGFGSR